MYPQGIGGVGAEQFCRAYDKGLLPAELQDLKLLVEIDRKGKKDAVYYDCNNSAFEKYISSKDFKTARGSFSNMSVVAPTLSTAAVNLSSGYYNAHTLHEYINVKHLVILSCLTVTVRRNLTTTGNCTEMKYCAKFTRKILEAILMIYTSKYSNSELRSGNYTAVRISIGTPRWDVGYPLAGEIKDLITG